MRCLLPESRFVPPFRPLGQLALLLNPLDTHFPGDFGRDPVSTPPAPAFLLRLIRPSTGFPDHQPRLELTSPQLIVLVLASSAYLVACSLLLLRKPGRGSVSLAQEICDRRADTARR